MGNSKYRKLSHVVYKCDYHIVWTPKYRYRVLFGEVKELIEKDLGCFINEKAWR
jgi:putative transposase